VGVMYWIMFGKDLNFPTTLINYIQTGRFLGKFSVEIFKNDWKALLPAIIFSRYSLLK
jgi:hypothetical protein